MSSPETAPSPAKSVAVVDMGANSIRMEIAQVLPDGSTEVLERAERAVRLGHDTFVQGELSRQTMNAAVAILRDFRRVMDTYGVASVHAVATTAVREAANRDAFLDRIATTVGIEIDLIEASEQCRLLVLAARHWVGSSLNLERRDALVVEVGGGSTLVSLLRRGEIALTQRYDLGSIRMQEMLSTAQERPAKSAELLRRHIANIVQATDSSRQLRKARTFLAIGGDARFAARRVGDSVAEGRLQVVPAARLDTLIEEAGPRATGELARIHHLPFAQAETLVPALLVYQALLLATRAGEMVVCPVSMRDGLLLDIPRYVTGQQDPGLAKSTILAARTLGAKYRYDAGHGERVAQIADRLFDELQRDHGLTPRHRLLLHVAAILHDVGKFINVRVHHKHSYYIIASSDIFGLRRQDVTLIAHLARYHRRSIPRSSHLDYLALSREDRMVVSKLAAILRVANALDRGHWEQVRDFTLERQGNALIIYVKAASDLILERRSLENREDLLEGVFGLRVRLEDETRPSTRKTTGNA